MPLTFSTSVLLVSKVRKFAIFGWEAVWSDSLTLFLAIWLAELTSDSLTDLSYPIIEHGLPQPPTQPLIFGLSCTRPPTFCHVICLSQSGRAPSHMASQICQRVWGERLWNQSDWPEDRTPSPARVQSAMWGHGSPRCWLDSTGRGSPIGREISKTGRERCNNGPEEPDRHLGLPRPHRLDSLPHGLSPQSHVISDSHGLSHGLTHLAKLIDR